MQTATFRVPNIDERAASEQEVVPGQAIVVSPTTQYWRHAPITQAKLAPHIASVVHGNPWPPTPTGDRQSV